MCQQCLTVDEKRLTWKDEYLMLGLGLSAAGRYRLIGSSSLMFNSPSTVYITINEGMHGERKGKHMRKLKL